MALPQGWAVIDWADVTSITHGQNQKSVICADGIYPIYGSGGEIGRTNHYLCKAGSTVVGRKGTIDRPFFTYTDFWNIDTAFGITPVDGVLPKFLFDFCQHFDFKTLDHSTGRPSLTQTNLYGIKMPLPPLAEQHRIVAKIDALFSELDKGMEMLQTVRAQLRTYRQAVLKKLYNWDIPFGIDIKCAGVVAIHTLCSSITDGDHQAPPQVKHGVPFLVISNITSGRVDYNSMRFVPEAYYDALDKKRVPRTGDVLYSVTGSFGIPAIVESDEPFCVQRHIAMLRPNKVASKYLFYMLQTPQVYLKAKKIATGTAQLTVPITGLRLIQIPIPHTEKEQEAIVAEIESRLSVCDKLEQLVDENLAKAQALRQSILKKAFAGELVPQDPSDEPAEKLLERIKAMKAAAAKTTTARRTRK